MGAVTVHYQQLGDAIDSSVGGGTARAAVLPPVGSSRRRASQRAAAGGARRGERQRAGGEERWGRGRSEAAGAAASTTTDPLSLRLSLSLPPSPSLSLSFSLPLPLSLSLALSLPLFFIFYWLVGVGGATEQASVAEEVEGAEAHASEGYGGVRARADGRMGRGWSQARSTRPLLYCGARSVTGFCAGRSAGASGARAHQA